MYLLIMSGVPTFSFIGGSDSNIGANMISATPAANLHVV
jgi:hypothetical protein